jgi:hypothetical protein
MTIVKVQTPMATNDPFERALVYAKGRRTMVQQSLTDRERGMMGSTAKAYFDADFDGKRWKLLRRVPDQLW